jgi:hypothetical protein
MGTLSRREASLDLPVPPASVDGVPVNVGARYAPTPLRVVTVVVTVFLAVNVLLQAFQVDFMHLAMYDFQYGPVWVADYYYQPHPDIVFLGSSRAREGFVPGVAEQEIARRDGVKVHALNMAITGSSIDVNYLVLKNVIQDDRKPRVIVYGFSEFELDPEFAPSWNLPYFSLLLRPDDLSAYAGPSLNDKVGFLLTTTCPICRDGELVRAGLSIALNPDDPAHKYFAPGAAHHDPLPGGQSIWLGPGRGPASLVAQNRAEYGVRLARYHVSSQRLARLNSFLQLARQRGIKVVLVNMPVTGPFRTMWPSPQSIRAYEALVRTVVVRNHATLVDLYRASPGQIPLRDFLDLHHLNLGGADKLTRLVTLRYLAPLFAHGGSGAS